VHMYGLEAFVAQESLVRVPSKICALALETSSSHTLEHRRSTGNLSGADRLVPSRRNSTLDSLPGPPHSEGAASDSPSEESSSSSDSDSPELLLLISTSLVSPFARL
jgi:hypothetical protein